MSSINNLSSTYLQSIIGNALQAAGSTTNSSGNKTGGIAGSSLLPQADSGQISPFAQMMSTLQQLQKSDPSQYQQVTQAISTNLQSAAKTAEADGNTSAANQLNQLATDFSNASKSNQLPNIQDLAKAIGGGGHHHHHHADAASSDSTTDTSTSSSDSLNPLVIIQNTLASSGNGTSQS